MFLHCVVASMSHAPGNADLKKLLAGSEPTKRSCPRIEMKTAFPAHIKVEQGKEVFENAKLHFDPVGLDTAV